MLITRKSILSGIIRTLDIPITGEQYIAWREGECIQDVAPTLSNSDREFILSGITQDEWDAACADPHDV
jgi:uncharacterized protein (DUF779 family)